MAYTCRDVKNLHPRFKYVLHYFVQILSAFQVIDQFQTGWFSLVGCGRKSECWCFIYSILLKLHVYLGLLLYKIKQMYFWISSLNSNSAHTQHNHTRWAEISDRKFCVSPNHSKIGFSEKWILRCIFLENFAKYVGY